MVTSGEVPAEYEDFKELLQKYKELTSPEWTTQVNHFLTMQYKVRTLAPCYLWRSIRRLKFVDVVGV